MAYNSCLDFFLVAETQQFERLCPSILQSVRLFAPYAGAEKHEDVHLRLCPPPVCNDVVTRRHLFHFNGIPGRKVPDEINKQVLDFFSCFTNLCPWLGKKSKHHLQHFYICRVICLFLFMCVFWNEVYTIYSQYFSPRFWFLERKLLYLDIILKSSWQEVWKWGCCKGDGESQKAGSGKEAAK